MRRRHLVLLLGFLPGCRREPIPDLSGTPAGGGTVSVEWKKGAGGPADSTGRFAGAAEARWCAGDTLLEVLAVRHDTAFGFSLLPADSLHAGQFAVYSAVVPVPWRPQAVTALRLVEQFGNLGFESTSGMVTVASADRGILSGTVESRLRRIDGHDSLHLTGRFDGLRVRPATGPCGRVSKPGSR